MSSLTAQLSDFLMLFFALLVLVLDLFQAVGDAVNDLAQRMMAADMMRACSTVFGDHGALYKKFTERNTVRSLCWVILDTPIDTTAVYKAMGGLAVATAFAVIPGIMA